MVVAKASRTGTGRDQPRCAVMGKWRYSQPSPMLPVGILHRFAAPLCREELRAEISPLGWQSQLELQ
jgi:hypothetical protein